MWRLLATAIRNAGEFDASCPLESLTHEMGWRPQAITEDQFSRISLGVGDEFSNRPRRNVGSHRQHVRRDPRNGNRHEALHWIERQMGNKTG
jgi:hypothetical protein